MENQKAPVDRYPRVPDRNARICARYDKTRAEKLSLAGLGNEFGLSRETVRMVILRRDRSRKRYENLVPLREAFARGTPRRSET